MSDTVEALDVEHQGVERVIGVYLLETDDGPALFDCGPASALPNLERRFSERGLALTDIRHLLLSHIHFDHAGAAGSLVREHPGLQVHVSELGAPHLIDPSRLEGSARRLYGEDFDRLWGEVVPVPDTNVHVVGENVHGLACFATPGHAWHHVCYFSSDGTLYAGDAAGVRIPPSSYAVPPTPPPEIDVETWERTLDEIERRAPDRLALTHFGVVEDVGAHLGQLRQRLRAWTEEVGDGIERDEFIDRREREAASLAPEVRESLELAIPPWQCFLGLERYWGKRREKGQATELILELERVLPGAPATVFRALTEPSELAQWWGPNGFTTPSIEQDLRVGGAYRIEMQPPEGDVFFLEGEFLEIEPPSKLAYTFRWEDPTPDDRETVATIVLTQLGESTRVSLTQLAFATEERRALHEGGWTDSFDKLEQLLAVRDQAGR